VPVTNKAAQRAWSVIPLRSVNTTSLEVTLIVAVPAIASSSNVPKLLFVVVPQRPDSSPVPISVNFNIDEYVVIAIPY
jgi:hypothetical protein